MDRAEFIDKLNAIAQPDSKENLQKLIKRNCRNDNEDLTICIGELAELTLELTRFQRGRMEQADFLQELSHVQWAIWRLQTMFEISDDTLYRAIQASFR